MKPTNYLDERLRLLAYELDGVLADVRNGQPFDKACEDTVTRVSTALHQLSRKIDPNIKVDK